MFLQPVCHPLLVVEQTRQMGHPFEEISVAGKPIGDDNPRDYLDTLQLNPYPLTCPLTAAFEQLGDNGQPGGMVKDHEPVIPLPFYLYPLLIDIDNGAFDMGDEKNRDLWLETQTHPQYTA